MPPWVVPRREDQWVDDRWFSLVEVSDSHAYALFRGYPPVDPDTGEPAEQPARVLDLHFAGLRWICAGSGIGPIHLRRADDGQLAVLEQRLGTRLDGTVFLLKADSVETYVVALKARWAEYELWFTDPSPLSSADPAYVEAHPPTDGLVHYLDEFRW